MFISYGNPQIRDFCNSLTENESISTFTSEEIKLIRTYMADLRSAPNLKDVPIDVTFTNDNVHFNINFGNIMICCQTVSKNASALPGQIKRIKVSNIINKDLQIMDSEFSSL